MDEIKATNNLPSTAGFYLRQLQQHIPDQQYTINNDIPVANISLTQPTIHHLPLMLPAVVAPSSVPRPPHSSDEKHPSDVLVEAINNQPTQQIVPPTPISTSQNESNTVNVTDEKNAIYRHPLFSLVRFLFDKCEIATNSIEHADSTIFDQEIKLFINQMTKGNKPFYTENPEVDTLMVKAVQVLAIHLLELEKVNELCKDFCTRYISCLKGKLNSENIMKTLDIKNTPPGSPNADKLPTSKDDVDAAIQTAVNQIAQETPEVNDENNFTSSSPILATRSASTSNIPTEVKQELTEFSRSISMNARATVPPHFNGMTVEQLTSGFLSKKKKSGKRGTLPKSATNVLKTWLFQHLVHPYPTEEEKKQLADQTSLSNLQVNNWFINARRRILPPVLDSTNSSSKNVKRSKQPRSSVQKGWSNTFGNYTGYRAIDAGPTNITQTLVANSTQPQEITAQSLVHNSSTLVQPAPGTMLLVNIGSDGTTSNNQQILLTQALPFVQLNQLPLQNGSAAAGYLHTISPPVSLPVTSPLTPIVPVLTAASKPGE